MYILNRNSSIDFCTELLADVLAARISNECCLLFSKYANFYGYEVHSTYICLSLFVQ